MLCNAALHDTRDKDFKFHSTPHATRNVRIINAVLLPTAVNTSRT